MGLDTVKTRGGEIGVMLGNLGKDEEVLSGDGVRLHISDLHFHVCES